MVVLGDAMLDVDIEGTAERLCPEAPVPVVEVARKWRRPGGAGLAAVLAARSTAEVVVVTALGDDRTGRTVAELLGRDTEVVTMPLRGETVSKTRVRATGQSLLRLDSGDGRAATGSLPARVREVLTAAGAILVADYGRGVAAHPGIRRLLTQLAPQKPVVWDPHPRGPAPIAGALLVTPNESEARQFAAGYSEGPELAKILRDTWTAGNIAVTIGPRGAVFADPDGTSNVPVPAAARLSGQARLDTCGAGDRFASAAAVALLDGATPREAVTVAVEAAARFVGAGGAAALSIPDTGPSRSKLSTCDGSAWEIAKRTKESGGRLVATGGCFDLLHPGHVSLLKQARALGDALIVCLNSDDSVRRIKGPGRPVVPARDRARLLTALSSVDAVAVFDGPSPVSALDRLRPDVWVKGGDYAGAELPESEVVRRHGGEIVLVPTVGGYSTTRLVAAANAS
jgi:rfaE bifunctional protein nucleotidyltransferase chain/domain/rfaE bifunctional protein kinase chain/domain